MYFCIYKAYKNKLNMKSLSNLIVESINPIVTKFVNRNLKYILVEFDMKNDKPKPTTGDRVGDNYKVGDLVFGIYNYGNNKQGIFEATTGQWLTDLYDHVDKKIISTVIGNELRPIIGLYGSTEEFLKSFDRYKVINK